MKSLAVGTTAGLLLIAVASGVMAIISPDQAMHPITGSLPPQGARCRAHAKEDVYWNASVNNTDPPAPLWLNQSLVPITWNFSEHCPLAPSDWEWSCCAHAQYNVMVSKLEILSDLFTDCPACQAALRNLMCWSTCGPYQYYTNNATTVLPDGQVLTSQFAVDNETSQRIWHSCENAVLGIATVKDTFRDSKVVGLLGLVSEFASSIQLANGSSYPTLKHILIRPTCDPDAINWNMTTVEADYACSNSSSPTKKPICP